MDKQFKALDTLEKYGIDVGNLTEENLYHIKNNYNNNLQALKECKKAHRKEMWKAFGIRTGLLIIPAAVVLATTQNHTALSVAIGFTAGSLICKQFIFNQETKELRKETKAMKKANNALKALGLELSKEKEEKIRKEIFNNTYLDFQVARYDKVTGNLIREDTIRAYGDGRLENLSPFVELATDQEKQELLDLEKKYKQNLDNPETTK